VSRKHEGKALKNQWKIRQTSE